MDRRDFLKGLAASGALGAQSTSALSALATPGNPQPVTIVAQAGLAPAAVLAGGIGRMLAAAGVAYVDAMPGVGDLGEYARIVAILDQAPGAHVIGVMDDAAALVFQAVAASRGAGYLMQTHHRVAGADVRHCCTVAGADAGTVWSDPIDAHAARIGRLYAEAISGRRLATGAESALAADGPAQSFVSFVITT